MLKIKNLCYRHAFSTAYALENIDLNLDKGESILLTGRSGSGKSTLLSVISGLIPHYFKGELSGAVLVNGVEPSQTDLVSMGLNTGVMLQNPEMQFFAPTVYDDMYLTLKCRDFAPDECRKIICTQLKKFGIEHIADARVTELSEGQKQKVVLAELTALNPPLILLDEPTANLDPASVAELKEILMMLKEGGTSFVIADHRLNWLHGLCGKCAVMQNGKIAWYGNLSSMEEACCKFDLRSHMPVIEECCDCFCSDNESLNSSERNVLYPGYIKIKNLSFSYEDKPVFHNFSADIPFGKVTVLNGPSGAGKTTLARILTGLETAFTGEVCFSEDCGCAEGICKHANVVLQNCDHQLYMKTVSSEISLAMNNCPKKGDSDGVVDILKKFGLYELADRHPQSLSGGEKQRLTIAAGSAWGGKLLILDEPTSGLDGHNLKLMVERIKQLKENGTAVIVITHDIELINLCADYKITLQQ